MSNSVANSTIVGVSTRKWRTGFLHVQEFLETVLLNSSATPPRTIRAMAQMQKDKGQPLTQTKTKNHPKKSFSNKPFSKDNILALGGSQLEADVDLLKDLDENEASGSANTDVGLSFSLCCYNSLFY